MLPPGFGLQLDPQVRRPRREVLVGGAPVRVLRLTAAGADLLDRWAAGDAVPKGVGAQALAGRLLDAGVAHPRPPAPADPPPVTYVVPVRDDPAGLDATIAALTADDPGSRIVVVDDGSDPPATVEADGDVVVLRRASAAGPGAARNEGWRAASTGIVVFLDAGCVPGSGWTGALLGHFADPSVAAAAPRVVARADPGTPAWLAAYEARRSPLDLGDRPAPVRAGSAVPYVPTAALAVRRTALAQADGFDERLRFGEDVDLVWRLGKRGWRVRYEPASSVSHPARRTLPGLLRQRFQYGLSAAPLAQRHGRDVAPLAGSPWSAASWGLAVAGHTGAALGVVAVTTGALARRAGEDRATARTLAVLALSGHARTGAALAGALRRAWLPLGIGLLWPRRTRSRAATAAVLAATVPAAAEWLTDPPPIGFVAWMCERALDDLAYQAGLWAGAVRARSAAALLPRW